MSHDEHTHTDEITMDRQNMYSNEHLVTPFLNIFS